MPLHPDARFWASRVGGLWRRGLSSLRTRGWGPTWRRLLLEFRPRPAAAVPPWMPAAQAPLPASLPTSDSPRASIVIPVHGALAHTRQCLAALAAHPPKAPFEVIVVDDASPDDSRTQLSGVAGLRLLPRACNGGFIAACNDGAEIARGDFLVFLNNDTVPQPGWLDALLATFADHPGTGLVGSRLVYPDGRLQEAGGVVFADGSAWNYGRFEDPADCRFGHVRDADYLSGAALAIPRALFGQLGGFDARYAPAYYEDTDLAFAVRDAGWRTLYQPASVVVHDEGATAGTDTASGPKAAQVRNRGVFADKWQGALVGQLPPHTVPTPALLARGRPQVLIIDALTPRPDRDSGSLRMVELMRLLLEEGAHVVFLPANRSADGEYTRALQRMGVESWHAPFAPRLPAWLREHGPRFSSVLVSRHYVARDCFGLLRRYAPQARLLLDTVDLHYLREQRAAGLSGVPAARHAAGRTRRQELALMARADTTLVVSAAERDLLARDAPDARVEVLSNLHRLAPEGPGPAQRRDLLFVGGFRHPPNVDAVLWFARDIFPLLRARHPALQFHVIGDDASEAVARLGGAGGIQVHGHVPDLSPWLDGCRVSVAPLRFGAGVKGKVNLAMAHGLPVVATPCAVEGMHLRDGHDVLVADDAPGFAAAVDALLLSDERWQALAAHGRENVARHFSLEAGREVVRRVLLARAGTGAE